MARPVSEAGRNLYSSNPDAASSDPGGGADVGEQAIRVSRAEPSRALRYE
jgi:hypothetical protein